MRDPEHMMIITGAGPAATSPATGPARPIRAVVRVHVDGAAVRRATLTRRDGPDPDGVLARVR